MAIAEEHKSNTESSTGAPHLKYIEQYRDLFDGVNDLVQSVTPDGSFLYVNRSWLDTLGYTEDDVKRLKVFDIIHPDNKEYCLSLFRQALEGVDLPLVMVVYLSKSGDRVVLEGDASVRFEAGKPVFTRVIFRNITKRVEDERRVRELASIVDRSFEAIVITDSEGIITYVNDSWQELNGWSATDVVGKVTPRIVKSGMQADVFYVDMWKRIKSGETVTERLVNKRKDGTLYHAEVVIFSLVGSNGIITGFAGFQHDVTARDLAEQKLVDAKTYAESIIDSANAIVAVLDDKGLIEVFSKKAEEITGYAKAELMGKNWFEILTPKSRYPEVWAMFEDALQHGFPKTFENPILTKDGRELIIAWTNSNRMKGEKVIGVITFGMDITERKKIEKELTEKNRDLEQFKDMMIGRELKMIELKKELESLKQQLAAYVEKTIDQK